MRFGRAAGNGQQNAASAEELASTAEQLSVQSAEMQDAVSFFRVAEEGAAAPGRTLPPARHERRALPVAG